MVDLLESTHKNKWDENAIMGASQYKNTVYQYRNIHYKDKTVSQPSYLYIGIL